MIGRSLGASIGCWIGVATSRDDAWRGWWARVLWMVILAGAALSVIRFVTNPLASWENLTIAVVLMAFTANAKRIRSLLAPPVRGQGSGQPDAAIHRTDPACS